MAHKFLERLAKEDSVQSVAGKTAQTQGSTSSKKTSGGYAFLKRLAGKKDENDRNDEMAQVSAKSFLGTQQPAQPTAQSAASANQTARKTALTLEDSPSAFVKKTPTQEAAQWQTDMQNRERQSDLMKTDKTAYDHEMAALQLTEADQKLQKANEKVKEVKQTGKNLVQQKGLLEAQMNGIQKLEQEYLETGSDVTAAAYLQAVENYNQAVETYKKSYAQYEKDTAAFDEYNAEVLNAQKAQMGYEKARAAYLEDHAAARYQDSGVGDVVRELAAMKREYEKNKESYNTEKAEKGFDLATSKRFDQTQRSLKRQIEEMEVLYAEKLAERDEELKAQLNQEQLGLAMASAAEAGGDGLMTSEELYRVRVSQDELRNQYAENERELRGDLWGTDLEGFTGKISYALQAGREDWFAGMTTIIETAIEKGIKATAGILDGVGSLLEMDGLQGAAKKLKNFANTSGRGARTNAQAAEAYMDDALQGTGKIDGWIIQQMRSVGAMMMDVWALGATGAMGLTGGASSTQILGVRAAGSAMMDAQAKGYSEMETVLYGAASGALEVLSEKLFGGNPIYDADDGLVTMLVKKVTDNPQTLRLMYSRGFDIMAEGIEEVFTEFLDPVAETLLTSATEIDWASPEELGDAFLGGVFLSLAGTSADVVNVVPNTRIRSAYNELGEKVSAADAGAAVVAEGLQADQVTDAYANAVKLQKKLDSGDTLTAKEIGKQLMYNQEAIYAGKLVDEEVEASEKGSEGTLQDPEDGIYAIEISKDKRGENVYRLAHVRQNGGVEYVTAKGINSLFAAKLAAEMKHMKVRRIATLRTLQDLAKDSTQLKQAEAVAQEAQETKELKAPTDAAQEAKEPENLAETAQEPSERKQDEQLLPEQEESVQASKPQKLNWAGSEMNIAEGGTEHETAEQNEPQRRADMGTSANQERVGGHDAGATSENPRRRYRDLTVGRAKEARRVKAKVEAAGGRITTLREMGLEIGSDSTYVREVPEEAWTESIRGAAEIAEAEGLTFVPVSGMMRVVQNGKEHTVNGVLVGKTMYIRVDSVMAYPEELAAHEAFHFKAEQDPDLASKLGDYIKSKYKGEQLEQMLEAYYEDYQQIYGGRATDEELEELIWEELLADAYAEYRRHAKFDVTELSEDVQGLVWAGSKETRELKKDEETFGDAYRATKNTDKEVSVNYSISYDDAIDQLSKGTLDRTNNTHLLVAEHTPQVFIDKAGAKDQKIITGWDTAYLAMNKKGILPGNYHGLGADIMKNIPNALEDPLYIVKQKNGRIIAITEVVVKGNRPALISVELDAFKTTTMDGEQDADNYNLIVTFFDARSNYLQNKVFNGDVKHNKNNEDPAHFISRLKSLNKAVPTNDRTGFSIEDNVAQEKPVVKMDDSLSDSDSKQLSKEQQEYFEDSKDELDNYYDTRFSADFSEDQVREKAEKELTNGIARIMSVPSSEKQELREGIVHQILQEYQDSGEIDQEKLDDLLNLTFARGLVVNSEYYDTYKEVKEFIRTTPVSISEQDRKDIADFAIFRKKAFGTLRISDKGTPVDAVYQDLMRMAPSLFPDDITHPADQLMRMYEKAREIRRVEIPLKKALGSQADQFYEAAKEDMNQLVDRVLEKYGQRLPRNAKETKAPKEQKIEEMKLPENYSSWDEPYDRANERMYRYGQKVIEGYRQKLGDLETLDDRTLAAEARKKFEQEVLNEFSSPVSQDTTGEERGRNDWGNMADWLRYVLNGGMTPEEFAEMNRKTKSRQPEGRVKEIVDRIENGSRNGNLFRTPDMTDEEYAFLNEKYRAGLLSPNTSEVISSVDDIIIKKADFTGSKAMEKLGIKVDGSVTRYRQTKQLRERQKAAYQAAKMLDNRIRKLRATEQEKYLARGLASGNITAAALDDASIDTRTVEELADYYMAADSFKLGLLDQRREEINTLNYRLAESLLKDSEAYHPKLPGLLNKMTKVVMNERTPERVVKQIFGAEQGQKIYDVYFRPVWVNGAEMNRFEGKMLDRVRTFTDKNGAKRVLTKEERAFAQRLMEAEAAKDSVNALDKSSEQRVVAVAHNLNNGANFADEIREWGLEGEEYLQGLCQAYADYLTVLEEGAGMDQIIVRNTIKTYSEIYNEMYDAMNDFLVSHGYEEIGFIKGYAPHFQKREVQESLFGTLKKLGVEKETAMALPASIAGRTADFKPNMRWNPHAQTRKGKKTDYDIQEGFERYLHYASEVFYHTDDVMRIRQAVNWYRAEYSSDFISEQIKGAEIDQFKTTAWKLEFLKKQEVFGEDRLPGEQEILSAYKNYVDSLFEQAKPESLQKYSEFVTWLDNYANIVAGKQSLADRGLEFGGGREALNVGAKLMRSFARANVAGNLSSALNQSAQLPLMQKELGIYLQRAMWGMARGDLKKEDFVERSDFLADKRGVEKLTTDNVEKILSGMFKGTEMVDRLASTLAVRGRYLQALGNGTTPEQAMREADDFARRVMGSRMKGAKPLAFESKTFFNQMTHVFQVEASNTFDYMLLSDTPQAVQQVYKTKGKTAAARYVTAAVLKYLVSAFLLNQMTEELYGGSPAPFDIMGWLLTFIAGGWGLEDEEYLKTVIDNVSDRIFGERPFKTEIIDQERGFDWAGSIGNLGYDVSNDIPYLRNIAGVMGWGDQSMPTVGFNEAAAAAGDAVSAIWNQALYGEEETGLTWAGTMERVGSDLVDVGTQFLPGGRQIKKTLRGIKTMAQGAETSGYGDNQRIKYLVDKSLGNWIQAALFGTGALDENEAYYAGGNTALTAGQTKKLRELEGKGINAYVTYDLYQQFREINDELDGAEASEAKRNAINALPLDDQDKLVLFDNFFLDHTSENYEKTLGEYQAMLDAGLSWNDVTNTHNQYADLLNDEEMTAEEKATELSYWLDQQGWSDIQEETVKERFKYWSMIPAEAARYEKYTEAGVSNDSANQLTETISQLKPEKGKEAVTTTQRVLAIENSNLSKAEKVSAIAAEVPERRARFVEAGVSDATAKELTAAIAIAEAENGEDELDYLQKARMAVDVAKNDGEAMAAMSAIVDKRTYPRLELAEEYGVTAEKWVDYKEAWLETYGEENVSQEKVKRVLDDMNMSKEEKAVLWQLANKSWKPEKNPYSRSVGREIYDDLREEEE